MNMSKSSNNDLGPSPAVLAIFDRLRAGIAASALITIRDDIDRHLLAIQKLSRKNEMTPLDIAEKLAAGLHVLLAELDSFAADHQNAILGAALYFVSDHDELPDRSSILGLDDDATLFNYVVRLIGRADLEVEL